MVLLAKSISFATFFAGICFFIFPAETGYARTLENFKLNFLFALLYRFDMPYNLVPSLHITYSFLISFWVLAYNKSKIIIGIFTGWLLLISISVLVIHQHHLLDIFSGILLALISFYIFQSRERTRWCFCISNGSRPKL
jgi:membrane-associated phospholipid phosphatase